MHEPIMYMQQDMHEPFYHVHACNKTCMNLSIMDTLRQLKVEISLLVAVEPLYMGHLEIRTSCLIRTLCFVPMQ